MKNTNHATDRLTSLMINEVAQTKVISREEERVLFQKYETATGSIKEHIRERLISANLRFVLKLSLQYHRRMGVNLNDLMSEGKIGLIKAVDLFDWRKDIKFISFAVWHIRCMISKYLEDRDLIRLPSHQKIKLNKLKSSGELENASDEMKLLNELTKDTSSFDVHLGDSELTLGDVLKDNNIPDPNDTLTHNEIEDHLLTAIDELLEPDEKIVIKSLFGLGGYTTMGIQDTTELVGKSSERVRQLRNKALKKLSKCSKIKEMYPLMNSFHD